jgi:hypothetical protein
MSCGSSIAMAVSGQGSGTQFRVIMVCAGAVQSVPSNVVTYTVASTCAYGEVGISSPCCPTTIAQSISTTGLLCFTTAAGTGLNGTGKNACILVSSPGGPTSDCACGSAWFVEWKFEGEPDTRWANITGGSPRTAFTGGLLPVNDLYSRLTPAQAASSRVQLRARTTCGGAPWSNVVTLWLCQRWYNNSGSPFQIGSIFIPAYSSYCCNGFCNFAGFQNMQVVGWCWEAASGTSGNCNQC